MAWTVEVLGRRMAGDTVEPSIELSFRPSPVMYAKRRPSGLKVEIVEPVHSETWTSFISGENEVNCWRVRPTFWRRRKEGRGERFLGEFKVVTDAQSAYTRIVTHAGRGLYS